jgi:hypothetical protein
VVPVNANQDACHFSPVVRGGRYDDSSHSRSSEGELTKVGNRLSREDEEKLNAVALTDPGKGAIAAAIPRAMRVLDGQGLETVMRWRVGSGKTKRKPSEQGESSKSTSQRRQSKTYEEATELAYFGAQARDDQAHMRLLVI